MGPTSDMFPLPLTLGKTPYFMSIYVNAVVELSTISVKNTLSLNVVTSEIYMKHEIILMSFVYICLHLQGKVPLATDDILSLPFTFSIQRGI